jgi:hypothetical protein
MYDGMTSYQKKFLTDDYVEGLEKYTARMKELVIQKNNSSTTAEDTDTDDIDTDEAAEEV